MTGDARARLVYFLQRLSLQRFMLFSPRDDDDDDDLRISPYSKDDESSSTY